MSCNILTVIYPGSSPFSIQGLSGFDTAAGKPEACLTSKIKGAIPKPDAVSDPYSDRRFFTGLARAARMACRPMVTSATIAARNPATRKIHQGICMR
jgi:hypothetical protein